MKPIKVLDLYACLGGNRYKWDDVADIEVTAVELDPFLADLYSERFPNDTVIIADAHQYLLDHYKEYDFIWSSPPCPTHSRVRHSQKNKDFFIAKYPDMSLYQEILFLKHHFKGKYVVENVIPYYTPLIPGQKRGRHIYWANFKISNNLAARKDGVGLVGCSVKDEVGKLSVFHDFDFRRYKGRQRVDKIARNLVDYSVGESIFKQAVAILHNKPIEPVGLFDIKHIK